ncbi:hypothetical protein TWF481_006908 [Arthrobotrys musiformis]|uniref:F-box domain-containing protein n=1 Tax=Arthrobotrys musiformis TaxID=47236 RepID=A0AAV9W9W5_9PEZI
MHLQPRPGSLHLPVETLSQIFGYLDFNDQLSASQTCALWQGVIMGTRSLRKARYCGRIRSAGSGETLDFALHGIFRDNSLSCTFKNGLLVELIHTRGNPFAGDIVEDSMRYPRKHITYFSDGEKEKHECVPIDITTSPMLDEPVMFMPDIDRSLMLNDEDDEDDETDEDGKASYNCYCDGCESLALAKSEDDDPEIILHYNLTHPGDDVSKNISENGASDQRQYARLVLRTHNFSVRDAINELAKKAGKRLQEEREYSDAIKEGRRTRIVSWSRVKGRVSPGGPRITEDFYLFLFSEQDD